MAGRPGYRHRQGLRRFGPFLRYPSWSTIAWLRRFYSGLAAGEGYCSLFPRARWSVTGDITPAYAILDDAVVRLVQNTVPADCRIVFIMRNPVDRLWSALRMHCRNRGMSVSSLTERELDDLSLQPEHTLRSDYVRTLEHWSIFGERLGLFFYEDLSRNPADFLARVLQFIGADARWQSPALQRMSNVGDNSPPLSDYLLDRWKDRYAETVNGVLERVGRVPDEWYK